MSYSGQCLVIGLFVVLVTFCSVAGADLVPYPDWVKCIGGSGEDRANSIQQTLDGGYIIAGYTYSPDGDMADTYHGGIKDAFVAKIHPNGTISWVTCIGGTGWEEANVIKQVYGGFVVAGMTNSSDGDMTGAGFHGVPPYYMNDGFVAVVNSTGSVLGVRCIGGSADDEINSIQVISGGYVIAGRTGSVDGDMAGVPYHSGSNAFAAVLNSTGSVLGVTTIGGNDDEVATGAQQITGGFVVTGFTESTDGNMTGSGNHGLNDAFVALVDNTGSVLGVKCLGGSADDFARSLQTVSGGYVITGETYSSDGNMTGYHESPLGDLEDAFVAVGDYAGTFAVAKCIGGSGEDGANYIQQTTDGLFVIAGRTRSPDGDMAGTVSFGITYDAFLMELNVTGSVVDVLRFGGDDWDEATSFTQTGDGGFVVAGYTESSDGSMTGAGYHGGSDAFVARIPRAVEPPSTIGVYSGGIWAVDVSGNGTWDGPPADEVFLFGGSGWLPVAGDWDGSGTDEIGVYYNNIWALDLNDNKVWDGPPADKVFLFGGSGWIPVVGNWDGSGSDEIGVYNNGLWALDLNGNGIWDGPPGDGVYLFGGTGWVPVIGDWNGDSVDEIGGYLDGLWALDLNGNGVWDGPPGDSVCLWGGSGWVPVVGNWNGDSTDEIGDYSNGHWALDLNGNGIWEGAPLDAVYSFGATGWIPVVGTGD